MLFSSKRLRINWTMKLKVTSRSALNCALFYKYYGHEDQRFFNAFLGLSPQPYRGPPPYYYMRASKKSCARSFLCRQAFLLFFNF